MSYGIVHAGSSVGGMALKELKVRCCVTERYFRRPEKMLQPTDHARHPHII
jgi:hypothetical protein